jgi:antirestriction protein ArdC
MTAGEASVRVADGLEAGIAPWSRSSRLRLTCRLAADAWTGLTFRGVDLWLLELAAIEKKYRNRFWATRGRWHDLGASVARGEGTLVPSGGSPDDSLLFNLEQVEVRRGAPLAALERFRIAPGLPDHEAAQGLLDATGAAVVPDRGACCVVFSDPSRDFIAMPPPGHFLGDHDAYWSVLFHELTHWVVLGRRRLGWDGDHAQGELIAELGAAILADSCGIPMGADLAGDDSHVRAWIEGMRADQSYMGHACHVAETAAERVLGNRGRGRS